ncbi:MAG: hypothetical protein JWL69_88 [Phycisphaerales bacterium]|nr:hypothetical protein [Phycisphaerales bacterium]
MEKKSREHLDQAIKYWQRGQPLEAGRLIFENLPTEVRPQWASKILELVTKRTRVKSPAIEHILYIADHPSEWKNAHAASSSAGRSAAELKKLGIRSAEQTLLSLNLALAIIVARVIYNSTNPPDEFDEDTGWWIASTLKRILEFINDDEFSQRMWSALCLQER